MSIVDSRQQRAVLGRCCDETERCRRDSEWIGHHRWTEGQRTGERRRLWLRNFVDQVEDGMQELSKSRKGELGFSLDPCG